MKSSDSRLSVGKVVKKQKQKQINLYDSYQRSSPTSSFYKVEIKPKIRKKNSIKKDKISLKEEINDKISQNAEEKAMKMNDRNDISAQIELIPSNKEKEASILGNIPGEDDVDILKKMVKGERADKAEIINNNDKV